MLRGLTRNIASGSNYIYPIDADTNANAFSLRKLRSGYTGSAVRVRRSSDNTEQDIGFVGNEFDSASFSSFVGAGQGFVTHWYNQGLLGVDATQTTVARQPELILSGISAKPSLSFNGTQDLTVAFAVNQASCSVVAIRVPTGTTTTNTTVIDGTSANQRRLYLAGTSTTSRAPNIHSGANFSTGSVGYTFGNGVILGAVYNSINTLSRIFNNTNKSSSGASGLNNAGGLSIGGVNGSNQQLTGQISEVITYASDIGDTAISTLISAVNSYYSVY